MSDFICPHCHSQFSSEKMAKVREETTRRERLAQLKETFVIENGWKDKKKKFDRIYLTALFFPIVLYFIAGGLLIKYGAFMHYLNFLIVGTLLSALLIVVTGAVVENIIDKKEDRAFSEWCLVSGN